MNRTNVSNVLVIGPGAAGLRAAIAVYEAGSEVVVVGKRLRKDAHTVLAAGGINAALGTVDPEDSWQHFSDTLREGYFLADLLAVEIMAREAPRAIAELVEYGCPFARTETGELDQRFFGAVTTRLHRANRLGGNSLSETVDFGRRAGEAAAAFSMSCDVQLRSRQKIAEADEDLSSLIREGEESARPLQRALRNTMWECCGVVRDEATLGEGLDRLRKIRAAAGDVDVRPASEGYADLAHALDLRASLLSAEASLLGAVERRETRGAHNRADFPEIDPRLKKNLVVTRDERGNLVVSAKAVDEVSGDLEEWARDDGEVGIAGRLLE